MIHVGYTREAEFTGSPSPSLPTPAWFSSIFSRHAPPTILEPRTGKKQKEKENQKNFQTVQFPNKYGTNNVSSTQCLQIFGDKPIFES